LDDKYNYVGPSLARAMERKENSTSLARAMERKEI
jgi:hypothetical protein